ncbi:FAD-binding oxidoreductase [Maritimibacter sp. UBA3975]|uniref:FAD-binding oxidoreductase n=1 Tax=Maritimibacter sp. UBA3975 TaxID=1946833 RepID=UPI000C0ADC39|nr:FAD-binding oxidoreductase [Maritimibacter sp. UBA3975]MAM60791.1 FAD-linked oxidase [Maritimibacter sp.]|tara:strand:+ start:6388 stop:7698 length:1311 start_codon:yes stop_codon:yes gene_type:complete
MLWKTTEYTGWGRVLNATGDIARPERAATLARIMQDTPAPAFGNRRSYGDSPLNDGGRAIDMTRMDKVLAFDPDTGIVEAEAGIRLGELMRLFAPRGWTPAVVPGTGFCTLGGAIANDVHGKNHHVAGSFGEHVVSVTLFSGGKRVTASPSRQKTLFRATMGGIGQTGVILSAKIKMKPCPGTAMRVTERRIDDWDDQIDALEASTAPYAVSWIDAQAKGSKLGRGILEEAELAGQNLPSRAKPKSVPVNIGLFSNSLFTKGFNAGYLRRIPVGGRTSDKPMEDFFFPLDKVHGMTKLYGKAGFHQFQCVVGPDQTDALRGMMERIARSGLASPLAVLKRMGAGRAGMLSFPMEGYTLAVDFPNRDKARKLIGALEQMCAEAGGRLYLAKDSLATGETIKAMYPEWQDWVAEAAKADPEGALITDMVRRLDMRSAT